MVSTYICFHPSNTMKKNILEDYKCASVRGTTYSGIQYESRINHESFFNFVSTLYCTIYFNI